MTLRQTGWASGANYSHTDSWNESKSLQVIGSYDATAPGGGWNLSSFTYVSRQSENATDWVKTSFASTNVSSVATLTGVTATGVLEALDQGNLNVNGRLSDYSNPTETTLPLPGVPVLNPKAGLSDAASSGGLAGYASAVPAGLPRAW